MSHSVQFISELTIFIHTQRKRPAALSAVQQVLQTSGDGVIDVMSVDSDITVLDAFPSGCTHVPNV